MEIKEINKRYTELSGSDCCLSCGGAIDYSGAKTGDICVDLGSGRGTDVMRLAEIVGETGFVYGIDISEGMLQTARRNAEKFGVKNVKFVKSDLEKIDLPSKTANIIISNCTINHASDKQAVWNEIYRILKGSGKFIVSDIFSKEDVPEEYQTDPVAVAECWAGSVTKDVYLNQLKKAGFENITILEESKPYLKGKIEVSSFTIAGTKPACNCGK
ncbi:MAG: hypothetical protein A2033_19360 [Bacteroidetes bacterium GWA2_31_9]|nr:MAG: hypothetical protein A2033_19360 [Bacteroidetes bacterium GWA2_31_9]